MLMRTRTPLVIVAIAGLLMATLILFAGTADASSQNPTGEWTQDGSAPSQDFSGEWTQDGLGCWTIAIADGRQLSPQPIGGLYLYPESPTQSGESHWFSGEIRPDNSISCGDAAVVISDAWTNTSRTTTLPSESGGAGIFNTHISELVTILTFLILVVLTLGVVAGDESVQYAALRRARTKAGRTAEAIFLRGRIMGFLSANEGLHFSGLSQAFGMGNHQTAHHLSQLEDEGHIWSRRDGRKLRFYTSAVTAGGATLPAPVDLPSIESVQARILVYLEAVETGQFVGTRQVDIARQIGSSQQLVSHHLKTLMNRGWVLVQGRGFKKNLRLTLAGSEALERIRTDDTQPPVEALYSHDFLENVG